MQVAKRDGLLMLKMDDATFFFTHHTIENDGCNTVLIYNKDLLMAMLIFDTAECFKVAVEEFKCNKIGA